MSTQEQAGIVRAEIAARLRSLTPARVGLAATGVSQQTRDVLSFQLAHARARDAVHARLDTAALAAEMEQSIGQPVLRLHSAIANRAEYLQRPDLGRRLDAASRNALASHAAGGELALIVTDGLSALAVERNVSLLLAALLPKLAGWSFTLSCVVEQGRVAIGDEIGEALGAQLALVLIGERPGLSSPDSLGAYVTWQPHVGRTDAERICISNIRAEGLSYEQAAEQLAQILTQARKDRLTGVAAQRLTEGSQA